MLIPAFADPVFDSQRTFRTLLDALARPMLPLELSVLPRSPGDLTPAATAALLTLVDSETPVWLQHEHDEVAQYLRFHCDAPVVRDTRAARFAVITAPQEGRPLLVDFHGGDELYPDRSATLIVTATGISSGERGPSFWGPGFATPRRLTVQGIPSDFWDEWRSQSTRLPHGVDVFFVTERHVVGLPRSARILDTEEGV